MAIARLNSYLEESRGWSSEPFTGYSASTSLNLCFNMKIKNKNYLLKFLLNFFLADAAELSFRQRRSTDSRSRSTDFA